MQAPSASADKYHAKNVPIKHTRLINLVQFQIAVKPVHFKTSLAKNVKRFYYVRMRPEMTHVQIHHRRQEKYRVQNSTREKFVKAGHLFLKRTQCQKSSLKIKFPEYSLFTLSIGFRLKTRLVSQNSVKAYKKSKKLDTSHQRVNHLIP